jgi:hypothetical protein
MTQRTFIVQKNPDQQGQSMESRSISTYAALQDNVNLIRCEDAGLPGLTKYLLAGALPIGSVEFVQHAFKLIGIQPPELNPYDICLDGYWHRPINIAAASHIRAGLIPEGIFIKPATLKLFNGFVYYGDRAICYDDHDLEQIKKFHALPANQHIYFSDVIDFVAEWRCYVTEGRLIAACRYDANDEDYPLDDAFVNGVVERLSGRTIAADIGLTRDGKFCGVELNDAWAIGKYQGISNNDYVDFLSVRWKELLLQSRLSACEDHLIVGLR